MSLLWRLLLLAIYAQCFVASQNTNNNAATWRNSAVNNANSGGSAGYDARISDVIAESVLQFARDVGTQLNAGANLPANQVFSPVSVMSALALLMLGAKGASYQELGRLFRLPETAQTIQSKSFHDEFAKMIEDIQLPPYASSTRWRNRDNWRNTFITNNIRSMPKADDKPPEHVLKLANGLFEQIGYSTNPDFMSVISSLYSAELMPLDFRTTSARDYINEWVKTKTFGKISNIIDDEISRDTNIILANALYFKGFWENSFFERATTRDDFYPDGPRRPSVKVPMMATGGAFPFYDSPEYGCRVIAMPYKGNLTTMYVIQPHNSSRARLQALQAFLDAKKIEEMISKMVYQSAVVAFPKMHLVNSINMKRILNNLGVQRVFNRGQSDLSLIGGATNYVSSAVSNAVSTANSVIGQALEERPIPVVYPGRSSRSTRAAIDSAYEAALDRLEVQRNTISNQHSELFVQDILHKVDFDVNEYGTEAAAATLTYLKRSGTDVLFRADTPFLLLIRHDPTKLPLFYGIINVPQ